MDERPSFIFVFLRTSFMIDLFIISLKSSKRSRFFAAKYWTNIVRQWKLQLEVCVTWIRSSVDIIDTGLNFIANPARVKPIINWPKYSFFGRLLETVAFILRLTPGFHQYCQKTPGIIELYELKNAKTRIHVTKISIHARGWIVELWGTCKKM